jgi:phosphoribosylamine--glycine ligase
MKILIVGNGAREHAIGWRLSVDEGQEHELLFAPGNPGTTSLGENLQVDVADIPGLVAIAKERAVDLTVVGPELPLSLGVVDAFQKEGLVVFGPCRAAAEIESSKRFAKEVMDSAGVATARHAYYEDPDEALKGLANFGPPFVIKADGLAAGKGVVVTSDRVAAAEAIQEHFQQTGRSQGLVLEEFLEGREASFIVMTDGDHIVPFPASHDYKRIFENDEGPNTGGMGTVSPTPHLSADREQEILESVIRPVLQELRSRDIPFVGFLYGGLMIAPDGTVRVVEFNARMGDPEAQVILRRWRGAFGSTLYALATGGECPEALPANSESAVCVVFASNGYPQSSRKGDVISGIEEAEALGGIVVFHAGTGMEGEELVTAGGRVLSVTALGESHDEARLKAYEAVERISFPGAQYRRDIAIQKS